MPHHPTTPTRPTPPPTAVRWAQALTLSCLLGLIALGLAWEGWLAPLRPGGSWLVLKVLPLTLGVAGVLKHRLYTYRWLSLLVWLYFTEGVVRATSDAGLSAGLATAEVLLCLGLFAACVVYIRRRLRHSAAPSTPSPPTP